MLPHDSLALCKHNVHVWRKRLAWGEGTFYPALVPMTLGLTFDSYTYHILTVTSLSFCGSYHPTPALLSQKSWTSVTYQGQNRQEGSALL